MVTFAIVYRKFYFFYLCSAKMNLWSMFSCRSDYEMLLALDERNHQHTGASTNLINSLPQSTIQVGYYSLSTFGMTLNSVSFFPQPFMICWSNFSSGTAENWVWGENGIDFRFYADMFPVHCYRMTT